MSGSIGSTPQYQPNVIQNSVQKNAQQSINKQVQDKAAQPAVQQNQNFQKIAQEIISQRAGGNEATQQQATQRGQVVDLLV